MHVFDMARLYFIFPEEYHIVKYLGGGHTQTHTHNHIVEQK